MKFGFIERHREAHSVAKVAKILGVSRGGYYAWRCRAGSQRARQAEQLVQRIREIQGEVKYRYGSPRITSELHRRGIRAGHTTG